MARSKTLKRAKPGPLPTTKTPFPKLAQPALRALASAGYDHLEQLANVPEDSLMCLHGFGPNAIGKLREGMKSIGLSLGTPKN